MCVCVCVCVCVRVCFSVKRQTQGRKMYGCLCSCVCVHVCVCILTFKCNTISAGLAVEEKKKGFYDSLGCELKSDESHHPVRKDDFMNY